MHFSVHSSWKLTGHKADLHICQEIPSEYQNHVDWVESELLTPYNPNPLVTVTKSNSSHMLVK